MPTPLDEVLAAAARLLAAGPEALTMDALAREAGVSRATLYRLVGGREQLLARLGEAEPADVRSRILAAAGTVFGRTGVESATIELVAREAGVGPATVYRQFGTKEGLIGAFVSESTQRRRVMAVSAAPSEDARADVERLVLAIAGAIDDERDLMRIILGDACREGGSLVALRQRPTRATHALAAVLRHHMDAGQLRAADPDACARALFGMVLANCFLSPLLDGTPPPDPARVAALVVPLFLDGLIPPPGGAR